MMAEWRYNCDSFVRFCDVERSTVCEFISKYYLVVQAAQSASEQSNCGE